MTVREWLDGLVRDNRTGLVSTTRTAFFGSFLIASCGVASMTFSASVVMLWSAFGGWERKTPPPAEMASLMTSAIGAYAALLTLFLGAFVTGTLGSKAINATAEAMSKRGTQAPPPGDAP